MFNLTRNKNKDSDIDLISDYRNKDDFSAFEELFCRYTHLVYTVCYKYLQNEEECKDAVLEIFEKLLEALKNHEVSNFKSWLYMVTKNHCLKKQEKSVLNKENIKNFIDFMENENFSDHIYENEFEQENLHKALMDLNEEQRKCIELFYFSKKSYNEIASITGYDLNQIKSFIQNGKRNLKKILS